MSAVDEFLRNTLSFKWDYGRDGDGVPGARFPMNGAPWPTMSRSPRSRLTMPSNEGRLLPEVLSLFSLATESPPPSAYQRR